MRTLDVFRFSCAAMNMTNINVQLLTIEAAATRSKEKIYQAAMLEPHDRSRAEYR
ncbi:MAG: hypothetical protein ACLVAT_12235 [Lachnospiraceae bacterium]